MHKACAPHPFRVPASGTLYRPFSLFCRAVPGRERPIFLCDFSAPDPAPDAAGGGFPASPPPVR